MNAEHATGAAKLVVDSAEIDLVDAKLSQKASTHDAGFDCNVQNTLPDNGAGDLSISVQLLTVGVQMTVSDVVIVHREQVRVVVILSVRLRTLVGRRVELFIGRLLRLARSVGEKGGQCHELSMPGTVPSNICCIHASGHDGSLVDENTANGCLVRPQSQTGLQEKSATALNNLIITWHSRITTTYHIQSLVHEDLMDALFPGRSVGVTIDGAGRPRSRGCVIDGEAGQDGSGSDNCSWGNLILLVAGQSRSGHGLRRIWVSG